MSTRDEARAETQRALAPVKQEIPTLTFEEFMAQAEWALRGWISRDPRPLSSWWMSVEDYARVEFNRAYVKDHPKGSA